VQFVLNIAAFVQPMTSMPMSTVPRDEFRLGLSNHRSEAQIMHPVQQIQENHSRQTRMNQKQLLAKIHGSAFPTRLAMDEAILSQFQRPPGLPSSRLGLEVLCNQDDDIDFADYLAATDNLDAAFF
jgi:proteasome maturation protein